MKHLVYFFRRFIWDQIICYIAKRKQRIHETIGGYKATCKYLLVLFTMGESRDGTGR